MTGGDRRSVIGRAVPRKEDLRLLTGRGRFSDDAGAEGQAHAAVVRAQVAHARLVRIDTAAARAMPGVLVVLTGEDCRAHGLGEIDHGPLPRTRFDLKLTGPGGGAPFLGRHPLLPLDRCRYVGEALAFVVAESKADAEAAAETVGVEYDALPAVTDARAAALPGAPRLWDGQPDNIAVESRFGDAAATKAAFAAAAHVVAMRFDVGRVTGVPLEPRSVLAVHDAASGRTTIHAGSGGAVRQKREMAAVLGCPADALRVLAFDVGGNFGTRNRLYPEFALAAWAARHLGRPVKFTATRAEAFVSDYQGRDLAVDLELALDAEGRFLALRSSNLSNTGARVVSLSPLSKGVGVLPGPYAFAAADVRARAVVTNTPPTNAYRSSGRPEVVFALERLIDEAAHRLGFDRVALRRLNLVPAAAMPYTNAVGMTYDSGDYRACLDKVLQLSDWDDFEARRRASEARGLKRGRAVAPYVESSIGTPVEEARLRVLPEGRVELVIGTQPSGQGHETSFAQVAADELGLAPEAVCVLVGDTDVVKLGGGSHSGRSMRLAGLAILKAGEALRGLGRRLAAELLEAAEVDLECADGRFRVAGTDRALDWFQLAAAAGRPGLSEALAATLKDGLAVAADVEFHTPVFPNGCHVAEVEVDPESGAVRVCRYVAVDDVGRVVNPMIVEGQVQGGIVQGLGQALFEACVFDGTGQPLAGSLLDYALPRAADMPFFATAVHEVPSPTNPLGVKAAGEAGTTPALAVAVNAVVDALREFGVGHIEMPATPYRVWQAIRAATRGSS